MRAMGKHTPGPWRACTWDPMERAHVHADDPQESGCTARFDLPRNAADARLMAAAPELLEALEEMAAAHQRVDPHHEDTCSNCIRARAAIAKAEGRE